MDSFTQKKYHIDYSFLENPILYGDTMLIQLGRLYCTPSFSTDKHAHINWYELTIVTEGEGIILTNDIPETVKKGDIYLSYPGDFHQILSSKTNPLKYDFFSFNSKAPEIKDKFRRISESTRHYCQRIFRDEQIASTVSTAIREILSKQPYHNEILTSLFEQILFYILRDFSSIKVSPQKKHTLSADELCFQLMHYIDTHIYSIESLSVLSEKFNYNYSYLSDVFKKTTNNTLANYYRSRRLDAAQLLLNEGVLKINQIAELLKYSSLYAFSKAFKEKYGISPKHYLKGK